MRLLAAAMQHLRMLGILILMIHFCGECIIAAGLLYSSFIQFLHLETRLVQ